MCSQGDSMNATDHDKASQNDLILEHLRTRGPITALEAGHTYECLRLGARIWELKRRGVLIDSEMVSVSSGKRVKEYRLANIDVNGQTNLF